MTIALDTKPGINHQRISDMLNRNIILAPWLSTEGKINRISKEQQELILALARRLNENRIRRIKMLVVDERMFVSEAYALYMHAEFLKSTAIYLSSMKLGTLRVTDEMIHVADRLLAEYLKNYGSDALVNNYMLIGSYEHGQLLEFYKKVPKEVYVSGRWHRPWTEFPLDGELDYAISQSAVKIDADGLVQLTDRGREIYQQVKQVLVNTGYLQQRARWMRISNFTNLEDYDEVIETLGPDAHTMRRKLIHMSGIKPGMRVLELGCGTGTLTFDDGLHQIVGATGSIVGVDLSAGMLARAEVKRKRLGIENVKFVQSDAENLPFKFQEFDAVVGFGFLHFTNIPKVLHEVVRVSKRGAPFVTMFPLQFPASQDFFQEWFGDLLAIQEQEDSNVLLHSDEALESVGDFFRDFETFTTEARIPYDNPAMVVKFFVEVANFFDGALSRFPWRARQEKINELIERGEVIVAKYGRRNLVSKHAMQWIRAVNS
ncbi:class I SAM-dependent methyltransferase [Alicyclobacillus sp. SO9]|uniref:class I SAM-dependent methyltransferase n=1 Tax=Alicyclobacillus sp. SO9 TaxID=2665646 RepID=UPI0018E86F76|nr:class I SAM-dependent methyltransferase [Alicyclobacillus sp. SO9]QQE80962.1 class I SAM-dependent methyltransferase [Alicyclobacillus sp. SO9]